MQCVGTGAQTEFEFIRSLRDRGREGFGECRGPLLTLTLSGHGLQTLEDSLMSCGAHETLWSGFQRSAAADMAFTLCAAHWMDISHVAGNHARQYQRTDWFAEASSLLKRTLHTAGWDPKEIANMVAWQRVQLT